MPRNRSRPLRLGFSTGTAAAAAAAGALFELLQLTCPDTVAVPLPNGQSLVIPLSRHRLMGLTGEGVVIKDAGDDPDVTHGAEIGARIRRLDDGGIGEDIRLLGGEGVGRVTKPGLPVQVGEPAINPVPRRMIRKVVRELWERLAGPQPLRVAVEIFVPRGEELARHTLNPRLGILGGISILGTTGLVKPFSHAAYRATILAGLRVAQAAGLTTVVLTTGGKSEEAARRQLLGLPEEACVQMGDYVRFALGQAGRMKFSRVMVAAFFGKAVKMAQGLPNTHASQGMVDLRDLGRSVQEITGNSHLAQTVAQANTARHALELLLAAQAVDVVFRVGEEMLRYLRNFAGPGPHLEGIILDSGGRPLWKGELPGNN